MSSDTAMPVLPTIDKRGKTSRPDVRARTAELSRLAAAGARHLADNGERLPQAPVLREVLTLHERYGQPPGDLAFTKAEDWTPDQQARAAAWLANERGADWWRAQAVAASA